MSDEPPSALALEARARGPGRGPPLQTVDQFLGRKPTTDAFFAEITGRR